MQHRGLERVVRVERRQQSRKTLRQHALAGARRADEEQAVRACSRDLERALCAGLATHVGQVRRCDRELGQPGAGRELERRAAIECVPHLRERRRAGHAGARRDARLFGIGERHDELPACARGMGRCREQAAHGPQFPGQRQFAVELRALEPGGLQLARGGEDSKRDREVVATAFLGQVRRREVDRQPAGRKLELALGKRRAHAIPALSHRGFRETDD